MRCQRGLKSRYNHSNALERSTSGRGTKRRLSPGLRSTLTMKAVTPTLSTGLTTSLSRCTCARPVTTRGGYVWKHMWAKWAPVT